MPMAGTTVSRTLLRATQVAENLAMLGAAAVTIQDDEVAPDKDGNIVPLLLDEERAKRAGFVREGVVGG